MPATYFIEPTLRLLYFVGFGSCTGTDYIDINMRAAADPRREPDMRTIIDMRLISEFGISTKEIKRIAQMDRELLQAGVYGNETRTALIARHDVDETIGHLYNLTVQKEALGVKIFYSLDQALDWLGLSSSRARIHSLCVRARTRNIPTDMSALQNPDARRKTG